MNYELAKVLKDAGFPQKNPKEVLMNGTTSKFPLSFPTLEELILVSLPYFRSLTIHSDGRWEAYLKSTFTHIEQHSYIGATPTEAVAKLYLALNKPIDNI